ncbi:MAG: alcohol dehydrogenase catalytic domain-containing protein [Vampirovibrionales bacterium]|nr:alcohol dehydrogenase catalytic domain-containing protein [Vampirovibrionales bacterium]
MSHLIDTFGDTPLPHRLPATMQAAQFYAPGDVRIETVPVPPMGPGELLVKMNTALTCGTDLKCYRRGHPVLLKNFPSPFGHEGAGEVAAIGGGVTAFAVGDRVVAANSAPCGTCFYCEKHQENLCKSLDLLNGTYAEYLLVPERIATKNTYQLPAHTPLEIAAFAEPLADALRGVMALNLHPGDTLAVLGTGPIGQLMIKAATVLGISVVAFGRSELKNRMAQDFGGATTVLSLDITVSPESIKARYTPQGRGFDGVLEAVGTPETWAYAMQLARKGGVVNWFGGCPGDSTVTLPTRPIHYDEIRLMSLFHHTPAYFALAVEWLTTGKIDPTPLITQHLPLERVVEGLEAMANGTAIKVAIEVK